MNTLRRHPHVEIDIESNARWYNRKKGGLGSGFVDEVESVLATIKENPLRFSIRFGNWRRANLKRLPYAVFYRFMKTAQ